jgi:hypothetical protein
MTTPQPTPQLRESLICNVATNRIERGVDAIVTRVDDLAPDCIVSLFQAGGDGQGGATLSRSLFRYDAERKTHVKFWDDGIQRKGRDGHTLFRPGELLLLVRRADGSLVENVTPIFGYLRKDLP